MTRAYGLCNMVRFILVTAILTIVLSRPVEGQEPPDPKKVINAPRPDYPLEARARHWTGRGIALVEVDPKTGYVTAARMLKSTGHVILDNAALSAFMRWRFKPGSPKQVHIPINYVM